MSEVRAYATPTVHSVTFDPQSNLADENVAGLDMTDAEGLLTPGSTTGSDKLYRFCTIIFALRPPCKIAS